MTKEELIKEIQHIIKKLKHLKSERTIRIYKAALAKMNLDLIKRGLYVNHIGVVHRVAHLHPVHLRNIITRLEKLYEKDNQDM